MMDDDVKIPNILWFLFAILLWSMTFVIGNETAESRKQIEIEKSLEYNDAAITIDRQDDQQIKKIVIDFKPANNLGE